VFPYDPTKAALLDWLVYLQEHLEELSCPGATVGHEIVMALHALQETLEMAS
jgi:hypothetical protein